MKYIKFIFIGLTVVLFSCQENRVKRLLPGEWKVTKHTLTDQFGFIEECSGNGMLNLGNCKKGDCSMTFDFSSTCSNSSYSWNETGTYQVVEKGADFLFARKNPDQTIDTIKYHIYIITSTDLKVDFKNESTNESHRFIFSRN